MRSASRILAAAMAMLIVVVPASAVEDPASVDQGNAPRIATVTLDFSTEIKTTFYSDGSVYEEGFDPSKMRRIATRRPSRDR